MQAFVKYPQVTATYRSGAQNIDFQIFVSFFKFFSTTLFYYTLEINFIQIFDQVLHGLEEK